MSAPSPATHTTRPAHPAKKKGASQKREQIESALRAALSLHDYSEARWQKLIQQGATDDDISHHLVDEFGSGGSSQTEGGIQFAYKGLPEPLFWLNASTHYTTMKPTLQGKRLVKAVRELLSIPPGRRGAEEDSPIINVVKEQLLEELEVEQRELWQTIRDHDEQLAANTHLTKGDRKRMTGARRVFEIEYERNYEEAVKALQGDEGAVQEVRDQIEMSASETAVAETPAAPVVELVEVFYALDLFSDGSHGISELGLDTSVEMIQDEDQTAVIGVSATGERRVVSAHNINLTPEEIIAKYGADARLVAPHAYRLRDGEEDPCCVLRESDPIHGVAPALETQAEGESAQAAATPVTGASSLGEPLTKQIEVELNDHDIAQKARAASLLAFQIEELEAEKKETDGVYKKRIGGLEEERDKLMREIRRGRAALELQVVERRDYERKVVESLRTDTHAVVESRPMRERELQQVLPSL